MSNEANEESSATEGARAPKTRSALERLYHKLGVLDQQIIECNAQRAEVQSTIELLEGDVVLNSAVTKTMLVLRH